MKWDGYTLMLQMNSGKQNLSSPLSLYMGFSDLNGSGDDNH